MQRRLKETQAAAGGVSGASQAVANEARKIETTLASRAPVRFLGIDVAGEKRAAAEVVNTAKTTINEVQQATSRFDPTAFWARQSSAATNSSKTVEAETKRAAAAVGTTWLDAATREERLHARRAATTTRVTSTIARDAKTGAVVTQAELAKIIGGGARALEAEAAKVGGVTGRILNDMRRLFLQNNFLFRQLGQRAAGDLGFAAVGVGKLALNFQQLAASSGGAGAELSGAAAAARTALGVFGPLGAVIGVGVVALASVEIVAAGVAAGLFLIARSVASTEQRFEDLGRQTGLTTDNLQALDIASLQSGTKLERLTNSVGQLQRKLIDASEGGTSRMSVGLKKLGIDLEDPNRALNQLFDILGKLPAGTVRTGAAMQIFGRGGREVAGVIDQIVSKVGSADGMLDRFKKQLIDAGVHISTDGTRNAAEFHDQMVLLEAQIGSVKRIIGEEALPTVLRVATQFSDWIGRNRVELGNWARDLEHTAEKVTKLGLALLEIAKLGPIFVPIITITQEVNSAGGAVMGVIKSAVTEVFKQSVSEERAFMLTSIARIFTMSGLSGGGGGGSSGRSRVPEEVRGFARFTPGESEADSIAKQIRDAFAQRGGRGGRGEDPAETARRLVEIYLQETLKGLQAERDALDRSLAQNLMSRDRFTQDAVNLELKRRLATIEGLKAELAEAERIRKPGQRAVKVAELNARIRDEERRTAKEITTITDDAAGERLRIGQSLAASSLRIIETQTEQAKARIRDYAEFRIITEQQAAGFEEQQTLRVFNARRRLLIQAVQDAGANAEKRAEAQSQLDEFDAERTAFIESSSRRIVAAIRNDAEHVVRFAAQIRDAFARAADVRAQAADANLEPLRNSILTRHQLWDAELQFEVERELQRHEVVARGFADEAALARIRIKNETELAATLAGIRAQEAAEEELHQARLRQLATQAAEQRRRELLQVANDLADIASSIFDAIGKSSTEFWRSLTETASSFAKQIGRELFKGLLQRAVTGQAEGTEGLVGMVVNPLLGAAGGNTEVANTKATEANTAAVNALTLQLGGAVTSSGLAGSVTSLGKLLAGAVTDQGKAGFMSTPEQRRTENAAGFAQIGGLLLGLFHDLGGFGRRFGLPQIFGGGRAMGGPVSAGKVYQIHDNEFFRPDLSGQILNLNSAQGLGLGGKGEVRLNVAVGQDAVDEMIESNSVTPKGRRATLVRAKYNRKVGKLLFA